MNWRTIVFYVMIVVIVVLSIYMIVWTRGEGFKCMASPLVYGVNHLQTSDNSTVTCTCSSPTTKGLIIVTKDNISYSNPLEQYTK